MVVNLEFCVIYRSSRFVKLGRCIMKIEIPHTLLEDQNSLLKGQLAHQRPTTGPPLTGKTHAEKPILKPSLVKQEVT